MDWRSELTGCELLIDEPMSRHTAFGIGGPADCILIAHSSEEIARARALAAHSGVSVTVIGNGSNLLVRDGGIRGLVIKIGEGMRDISVEGTAVTAQAGASLRRTANAALDAGLTGLEFASGIPGNVGGALYMNAGAYGFELSGVTASVEVVTAQGAIALWPAESLEFGYRTSRLQRENAIATKARFSLTPGDPAAIRAAMADYAARRSASQPLDVPSAGSTFKRPPGHFAGKLIQDAGLKGTCIGAAQVSPKHAGFIVNNGGATAAEVLALIAHVQQQVLKRFGVKLEPELRVIGED